MGFAEHLPDISLVFNSVFLALGLASNFFVCFIMTRRKLTRKSMSNLYIFHLSLAEVIYRMVQVIMLILMWMIDYHLLTDNQCMAIQFIPHATCSVIFVFLAGIAMDRKTHIINPLKNLGLTKRRKTRIAFIWLFSVVISVPIIFGAHVNPFLFKSTRQRNSSQHFSATSVFRCVLLRGAFLSKISFTIYFLLAFLVPLSIITHSYCKIFFYLRKRATKRTMSPCYIKSKYKALRMLVLIVLSFLLSWGPFMLIELAKVYGATVRFEDISVKQIAMSISLTSSVIHPVIYSFGNENFRYEVVKTFRCCEVCFSSKTLP